MRQRIIKKSYARTQKEERKTTYFGVGTTEPNFQENYKTLRKKNHLERSHCLLVNF